MKNRLNSEKGFTLIELVMVIVILGILAATAIPKFVDLSTSAENSVRDGVTGALQGTITMLQAQYLINDTAVTAALVAAGVDTQGVTVTAPSGVQIQATGIGTNTYTWTYAAGVGNGAPTVTLD
jgi:MSHA pilin protein MshA